MVIATGVPVPSAVPIISPLTVSAMKDPVLALTVKDVAPARSVGLCVTERYCGTSEYKIVNASP